MQSIEISHPSIGQIRKLRKGMATRIKKGTGFNLIVHPNRYNQMAKTFSRDKGIEVSLSPEELQANKEEAPSIEGGSIFGSKFDKKHPALTKSLYEVGRTVKPLAKEAVRQGIDFGARSLSAYAPEFASQIESGSKKLNQQAQSYIEDPDATYRRVRNTRDVVKGIRESNAGGSRSMPDISMMSKMAKGEANSRLNKHLGTNYDYMSRAGLESAGANALQAKIDESAMAQRYNAHPIEEGRGFNHLHRHPMGYGFHGFKREVGSIGRGAGLISGIYLPPAMMSQPSGANFQMQHFLPPQYHQYWNPAVEHSYSGMGLYA